MEWSGENKRARIERGQFLFLELYGELFGIDLSGDGGGSDSQISSLSGVTRCRLDLENNGYPTGMCHVKMGNKHYLIGGIKSNLREKQTDEEYRIGCCFKSDMGRYSDDVYELQTDFISRNIIQNPTDVLKPAVPGTRMKEPKTAEAFNLKGKYYLLHTWAPCYRAPSSTNIPFERLDFNEDIAANVDTDADAAPPPFSCHEVPMILSPFGQPAVCASVSDTFGRFILDDKLVLFVSNYAEIYIFTPPHHDDDDDDSGNGKWSCLDSQVYDDSIKSFESLTGDYPSTGIFLSSEFQVPDPDDVTNSLRVLLAFDCTFEPDKESNVDAVLAYAICTKTFQPRYCQKLEKVLSNLIPDSATTRSYFLEDVGKGDLEGTRRMCAIMTATGYVDAKNYNYNLISYLSVSVFDVQLIQPLPDTQPPPAKPQFLKVFPPIKKLAFRIDNDHKFRTSPVVNAFLV